MNVIDLSGGCFFWLEMKEGMICNYDTYLREKLFIPPCSSYENIIMQTMAFFFRLKNFFNNENIEPSEVDWRYPKNRTPQLKDLRFF
jgi:hypothetical protein